MKQVLGLLVFSLIISLTVSVVLEENLFLTVSLSSEVLWVLINTH